MLRRLNIRGKILAVVAVPILVLILAATFVTVQAFQDLDQANNVDTLLDTIESSQNLTEDLQDERHAAVNYVNSYSYWNSELNDAFAAVAAAMGELEALADEDGGDAADAHERLEEIFDGGADTASLTELRASRPETGEDGWLEWPVEDYPADEELAEDAPLSIQQVNTDYELIYQAVLVVQEENLGREFLGGAVSAVELAVRQERDRTSSFLNEPRVLQETLELEVDSVDAGANSLASALESIEDTEQNERVRDTTELAVSQIDFVQSFARPGIQNRSINQAYLGGLYSEALVSLIAISEDAAATVQDPELTALLQGYAAMETLIEAVESEGVLVERLIRSGEFAAGEDTAQRSALVTTNLALASAQRVVDPLLDPVEVPPLNASVPTETGDQISFTSIRTSLQQGTDQALLGQRQPNVWPGAVETELEAQKPIRDQLWTDAQSRAADTARATQFTTILTIVAAVVVVLASFLIAQLIARRIVGPLRRLTTTATAVRQELPRLVERVALPGESVDVSEVQIPVESSDEVGRLAEAFNSVNAATLAIAGEQAALRGSISEMFVNVARRDQVLLNRQLASIDEMERTEDNPNTLTRLFALDHLATRMRRNSESLLVLAGIDTGRRLRRPMPLSDVIRTASSEIELYERVQLELDADPAMVGHSALTAAHLFAELLENATVFSDPGTPVVVRTSERDGNFVVEVVDGGIGMTPEELQEANARVASTAASEILGAQRLGLFVVGRIARRVGARVEISSQEGVGTTAIVTMPPAMFDLSAEVDMSHTLDSPADSSMHAPAALVSHRSDDEIQESSTRETRTPAAADPVASVGQYQPTVIEESSSLSGRGDSAAGTDAPVAPTPAAPVVPTPAAPTTSAAGLPSRRRGKAAPAEPDSDTGNIIGLPARATPDQLSALAAETSGFTPSVAANELAPQTAEQRASMFRGFRPRGENAEPEVDVAPDAESLGQAARRGAVARDDVPVLESDVPVLEDDPNVPTPDLEEDSQPEPSAPSPLAVDAADARDTAAPVVHQSPLISTGYQHEDNNDAAQPVGNIPSFEVPTFGNDDASGQEQPTSIPALEDDEPAASPGVEQVSLVDDAPQQPAPQPPAPQPPAPQPPAPQPPTHEAPQQPAPQQPAPQPQAYGAPAPQGSPYGHAPEPQHTAPSPPAPAPAPSAPAASAYSGPSLDELIAGDPHAGDHDSGFFGKLFGRGKKAAPEPEAPRPTAAAPAPPAFQPTTLPQPTPPVSLHPEPQEAEPAPSAPSGSFAPGPESFAPSAESAGMDQWATSHVDPAPMGITPPESATPYNPGRPGTPAPAYSADQLANPHGWETAGASALEASRPDVHSSYMPVVNIQPAPNSDDDEGPDIASQVFSELSSLSSERPKVEKTRAGLAKRRSEDAPPVEVKPIEQPTESKPANRDPEELRTRFSSFYSGTKRARDDVAELDQRSQTASAKD